jgi:subtilase family serine protease
MRQLFAIILIALLLPSLSSLVTPTTGTAQPPLPDVQHPIIYRPASLSSPGVPPFVPADLRKAYNFLPLYSRGVKGNGTRIAIVDAFGDPTLSTDLSSFNSLTGLPTANVNIFYPDGVPKKMNSGWAVETSLDVEWAHAIAPSATIDLVVALDSTLGSVFDGIAYVANSLPSETVLSMSFGLAESSYPTTGSFTIIATHQLFVTMTSHGTTPFASSGDSGATSCCNPQYPSSDPLVVAVGGTSLTLNNDASYGGETTWSGSGAGSSTVFSKPIWQQGHGDSMRDAVDVSYDADPNTGVLVVQGGREFQVGGTSAGAPQWAALVDLASQANSKSYGSINANLYKIGSYHDITSGSNGFFAASVGWDYPTGFGTPDANGIVSALSPAILVALNSTIVFQGINVTTTGSLGILPTNGTLSGTAMIIARNATSGSVLFNKTYTITSLKLQNATGTLQGMFTLNVGTTPYPLSSNIMIRENAGTAAASVALSRRIDVNGDGIVNVQDLVIVALAFGSTINNPGYNPRADIDGNGSINILDLVAISLFFGAVDFT